MDPSLIVLFLTLALALWLLLPRLRRDRADRTHASAPRPRASPAPDDGPAESHPASPIHADWRYHVTVNGRRVDAGTANDVAQRVGRLTGPARVPADAGEELRHLLEKGRIVQAVSGEDLDARLRQLKQLHEQRLITDIEYAARKADMVSSL